MIYSLKCDDPRWIDWVLKVAVYRVNGIEFAVPENRVGMFDALYPGIEREVSKTFNRPIYSPLLLETYNGDWKNHADSFPIRLFEKADVLSTAVSLSKVNPDVAIGIFTTHVRIAVVQAGLITEQYDVNKNPWIRLPPSELARICIF